MPRSSVLLLPIVFAVAAQAQQPIGTLKTEGAEITGLVTVSGGKATIGNNGAVAAGVQPSDVELKRGGNIRICAGSQIHLSQPTMAQGHPPLLLGLDRGAIEIKTKAEKTDSILTPDLRLELSDGAPLDLRIRVVPSGDTCVENAGKDGPVLHATATFGDSAYFVRPGQRVLFEHGSLREVVDHETSSCGCPRVGGTVLAGKGKQGKLTEAEKANPFPEAVSQGLAPNGTPPAPQPAGQEHVQVSSTLNYSGNTNTVVGPPGQSTTAAEAAAPASSPQPTTTITAAPATPPPTEVHRAEAAPPPAGPNPFRAIGHFFRRLFGVH